MNSYTKFYFLFLISLISCQRHDFKSKPSRALSSIQTENLICEDLFSAACLNADGTLKEVELDLKAKTSEMFNSARTRALKAMGYSTFEEAFADRLKEAGLQATFDSTGLDVNLGIGGSCQDSPISPTDQVRHFEIVSNHYAQDLGDFLFYLAKKCKDAEYLADFAEVNNNFNECKDQLKLRNEVSQIYRLSELEQKQKAKEFIAENVSYLKPFNNGNPIDSEFCTIARNIQMDKLDRVQTELTREIQTSRQFVETTIDHFYSLERMKKVNAQFFEIKGHLKDIFSELNSGSPNAQIFNSSMDTFELRNIPKPTPNAYTMNSHGASVLKNETGLVEGNTETYTSIFNDENLSYFNTTNATYYSPAEIQTVDMNYSTQSKIALRPAYWGLVDSSPATVYSVLAHEAGHKFSPQNAEYEGYGDLNDKFKELFNCFSENNSINMTESQKSEVMADYISAEIVARKINSFSDQEKRREFLIQSVANHCDAENEHLGAGLMLSSKHGYPPSNHRCSGIYGANPNIRRLIGCTGESSLYKSCGLNLSLGSGTTSLYEFSEMEGVE